MGATQTLRIDVLFWCAVLAIVLVGCNAVSGDQWFYLNIANDTGAAVTLYEPSPLRTSGPKSDPLKRLAPGDSYRLSVLANGGTKTYGLHADDGTIVGCLPTSYPSIPKVKSANLSSLRRDCPKQ